MQKRGIYRKAQIEHEFYYILAQLLLIVLVGFALFSFVGAISQGTLYNKNYISRDVALIIDTIYASPGDIHYVYPVDISEFIINFKKDNVEVYEELKLYEKMHPSRISYPILVDRNIALENKIVSPDLDINLKYEGFQLKIDKVGDKLIPDKNE